ncbi:nucleotide disphospho-sugar-binding domain-containing protein [Kitasatospora sp. NPDC101801]|uniref:nucleotide disphospho-sugar-binding domain-containing protein n=1 Tax=Kitasatospora sp. NPDC101801 TaxID=3364103 RepID=UPI0037FE1DE6
MTELRVLVTASGWPTHYMAMVPLAWALRAAGHEIRVAAQPSMRPAVVRSGMPMVPVGPDVDYLAVRRRTLPQERADGTPGTAEDIRAAAEADDGGLFGAWAEATGAALDDTVAFARAWRPDLVIGDTMAPAGLVAAHVLGVPGVRHLWGPDILGSEGGEKLLDILPGYWEPYRRHGLDLRGTDPAHRTVSPCPPSLQAPPAPTRLQLRWPPYNGPGTVPDWADRPGDRPRIALTWGTSTTGVLDGGGTPPAEVLAGLAGLDAEIVVAVTAEERERLGTPPPGVRVLENLPLHVLLPGCALLVHQGGFMTALTAAHHGVPQLLLPQLPNQISDAEVLAGSGAARVLPTGRTSAAEVRAAAEEVLGEGSYAEAARRLRAEILAQPTPREVAETLCELAAGGS